MNILEKSDGLTTWINHNLATLRIPASDKGLLAGGCYDITLEHQRAIVLLVGESLYGSAFALAKSVFESFVRGVWIHYCASETELSHFKKGKFDLSMGQMISRIEELEGYSDKVLTALKQSGWASLNQYSHSGILQIARRRHAETEPDNVPGSTAANYSGTEISELLNFVNNIAILAGMEMALLSGQQDIQGYLDKITEYHEPGDNSPAPDQ